MQTSRTTSDKSSKPAKDQKAVTIIQSGGPDIRAAVVELLELVTEQYKYNLMGSSPDKPERYSANTAAFIAVSEVVEYVKNRLSKEL